MILADSSVWIDHLRKGDPHLADLLLREQIVMHTIIGRIFKLIEK